MTADPSSGSGAGDLQFDRAIAPDSPAPTGSPVCERCKSPIRMHYYHVDGQTTCPTCKQAAERALGGPGAAKRAGMMKAVVYGVGAAIAGAIIYYAVMEYMDLEIGIVAILIGFMVGYAVRAATSGRGGRRFQILAAGLTYLAVALAYAPFALRGVAEGVKEGAAGDSGAVAGATPSAASATTATADEDVAASASGSAASLDATVLSDSAGTATEASLGPGGIALAFGGALLFVLALPVIVIFTSMPSGLISALIIGIGMRQAWTMTRGVELSITGPFKVGSEPSPAVT
jgi:hypothetical protein